MRKISFRSTRVKAQVKQLRICVKNILRSGNARKLKQKVWQIYTCEWYWYDWVPQHLVHFVLYKIKASTIANHNISKCLPLMNTPVNVLYKCCYTFLVCVGIVAENKHIPCVLVQSFSKSYLLITNYQRWLTNDQSLQV